MREILNVCTSVAESKERRAGVRFFMRKGVKPKDSHAELEQVDGSEALAPPTVKK
jgi:hypothetical protein